MEGVSKKLKRNISLYYDASSFTGSLSGLRRQKTTTDADSHSSSETLQDTTDSTTIEVPVTAPATPAAVVETPSVSITAASTNASEAPLPFRPSLWRAPTSIHVRSISSNNNTPDLERGPSMKSGHYREDSARAQFYYNNTDLHRDNSIATAISMRRADIMVSRDNPQNLHQQRLSGVLNSTSPEGEEISNTGLENGAGDACHQHAVEEKDELLYEKKKSVIILLGRLLIKCGCPFHRVVI